MGALASKDQVEEVKSQIAKDWTNCFNHLRGPRNNVDLVDADSNKGAFLSPILLLLEAEPHIKTTTVHEVEAFGPVSTLMPYKDLDDAVIHLAQMGKGSLVSSIATYDNDSC